MNNTDATILSAPRLRSLAWAIAFVWTLGPPAAARSAESALREMLDRARERFAVARFYVKPNPEDAPGQSGFLPGKGTYQVFIDEEKPVEISGVILKPDGTVLAPDICFDERYLDYVEIETAGGRVFKAQPAALPLRTPGLLLKPVPQQGAFQLELTPFAGADVSLSTGLLGVKLRSSDGQWNMLVYRFNPGMPMKPGQHPASFFRVGLTLGESVLIASTKGDLLGCALTHLIDPQQQESVWKGPDLLSLEAIPCEKLRNLERSLERDFLDMLYDVKIEFREKKTSPTGYSITRLLSRRSPVKEMRAYALPVGKDTLLVPTGINRSAAARISRITIRAGGRRADAVFLGAYRPFHGFLIKSLAPLPHLPDLYSGRAQSKVRPFLCMNVKHVLGGLKLTVHHNRCLQISRRFRNRPILIPIRALQPGDIVLDINGKLSGIYLCERKEDEEQTTLQEAARRGYASSKASRMRFRIHTFSELRDILTAPQRYFDPRTVVLPKSEEKPRPWLGVEYTKMIPDLAKKLHCEKETKDGKIGLLVGSVYPGSPAERLGLEPGVVLLSITEEGKARPIELLAPPTYHRGILDLSDPAIRKGMERLGIRYGIRPPWRSRANYLTALLDTIGIRKKVRLRYLQDGKVHEKSWEIEQAPPDFSSAPQCKDDVLGLTLKDITYEVRLALRLGKNQAGVVVAKVESGGPAAIAKIAPYEIILSVDSQPVSSAEAFRRMVEKARNEGRKTVKLIVFSLGQSRIVDLSI